MKDRENGSLTVGNPHRSKLAVVAVLGLLALLLAQLQWSRFGEGERLSEVDSEKGETIPLMASEKEPLSEPPTVGLFSDGAASQEQQPHIVKAHTSRAIPKKDAWREPLDLLIAAGRAQEDPAAAIAALLTAQPGMGDQLLTLLLETEGGQDEQDALMVALATALSIGKKIDDGAADHLQQEGAAGVDWASLWFDRGGTILAMADLWICGEQRARYFPRFLQVEGVMQPWHAIELASMMESTDGPLPLEGEEEESRTRLLKMIEWSLATADHEAVAVAGEWLQSPIPELRRVAQNSVVSALVDDPAGAANWIGQAQESLQVPLIEVVLHRISGAQLPGFLQHAADLMLQQEYHGSALLSGFSRATDLDLQQMIYQRGDSIDSEGYRNLVLYGSQGGIGRGGSISPGWAQSLKRVAQSDPSRSVRGTALRICAMSWPTGDAAGFQRLIETSDVDPRTAEIAASLLNARGSAGWSPGD